MTLFMLFSHKTFFSLYRASLKKGHDRMERKSRFFCARHFMFHGASWPASNKPVIILKKNCKYSRNTSSLTSTRIKKMLLRWIGKKWWNHPHWFFYPFTKNSGDIERQHKIPSSFSLPVEDLACSNFIHHFITQGETRKKSFPDKNNPDAPHDLTMQHFQRQADERPFLRLLCILKNKQKHFLRLFRIRISYVILVPRLTSSQEKVLSV